MKRKSTCYHEHTLSNGMVIELELPVQPEDWEDPDVQLIDRENDFIMGYIAHDPYCSNPLEDCGGMGSIIHHPCSRYGDRNEDGYYEALGCDSYGDPIIDYDKVQMMWRDKVFGAGVLDGILGEYHEELLNQLADEEAGDYNVWQMCKSAWQRNVGRGGIELSDEDFEAALAIIEPLIEWDWGEVSKACWIGSDPYAVLLDRYEHGLCRYSLHSSGGCPWDTSRGEAVWVPDEILREELDNIADPDERRAQAVKYADQACDTYTDWCNGECYGVVTAVFDRNGVLIDEDSCWGYVGSEWAKESLKEQIAWRLSQ